MTRVLVIDDEDAIRQMIVYSLKKHDFDAFGTASSVEGIELARNQLPDLIICDVRMELVNGYQMLTAIRNDPVTSSIPFILITADQSRSGMRQGMELGADDYLEKPFTPAELIGAVNARLQKHRALLQQAELKIEELRAQLSTALPHELHTPLNGILGYADILRKQFAELEPIEVSQMAERIYKNGKRLHRLVENFLIYAQLEVLKADNQKIEALCKSHMSNVSKLVDAMARQKAYESTRSDDLQLHLADADIAISSDYFSKVFEELFDNALRYSKKGSLVHVQTNVQGNEFLLQIKDQGRGMTAEQIQNIGAYTQFERKIYEQQGSGLGMTVAKRLIELHGGALRIESEYGSGTSLTVTLPLASPSSDVKQAAR